MNAVGIALVWCALQVTLVGLLAGALYSIVRRLRPAAGTSVPLTGLLIVAALTTMALSPWPRWSFGSREPAEGSGLTDVGQAPPVSGEDVPALQRDPAWPQPSVSPAEEVAETEPAWDARFWHGLIGELTGTTSPPAAATTRRWPAVVAILFLTFAGAGSAWLLAGMVTLRWYRSQSEPIEDPALARRVGGLRAELGCRSPVEVRQSTALVTAATIGWRRPVILLPSCWKGWTEPQCRAVLAHEIAHIKRRDYLACICGHVALALHGYHPLVHWLARRLRLEQELAADAVAAGAVGGKRPYLQTLAELALAQDDRPISRPARAFLPTRTTFLRRIEMLRQPNSMSNRVSGRGKWVTAGLLVVFGLIAAGFRGLAADSPPPADAVAEAGPAVADDSPEATPAAEQAKRPVDLSCFSPYVSVLVAVRPAEIPKLEETIAVIAGDEGLPPVGGVPFNQFELVALGFLAPGLIADEIDLSPGVAAMVRTTDAEACEKLVRAQFAEAVEEEIEGRTYHTTDKKGDATTYVRLDERTLAVGLRERLPGLMRLGREGGPKITEGRAWREVSDCQLALGLDCRFATMVVRQPQPDVFSIVLSALWPGRDFWEASSAAVLGVRIAERTDARLIFECRDEAAAREAESALESGLLAGGAVEQISKELEKYSDRPSPEVAFLLDVADRLLKTSRVKREGNLVRVLCSVDSGILRREPLAQAMEAGRKIGRPTQSAANLGRIARAMLRYHKTHGCLPPAVGYGPDGKTPHSWRVALLPLLDEQELYDAYRFDEPWDGPHNRRLWEKMPDVYRYPGLPKNSTDTAYFVLTGPETVFSETQGTRFAQVPDGLSDTILAVEAKRPVPWTKPEDIPYDSATPLPALGGFQETDCNLAFCDGSLRRLPLTLEEKVLRAMITKAAGD